MAYALLSAPILLVLAAVWLGLSVRAGTVSAPTAAVLGVGIALGLYASLMLIDRGFDFRYRNWGGSPSFEDAQEAGRVVATYTSSCTGERRVSVGHVFAEQLTRKELGPLLWPRHIVSDAVKVVVYADSFGRPHPQLVFDDGAGATVDQETGKASPRAENLDETRCCSDIRLRAPDRFWLVQEGERICEFTRQPASQDA